MKKVVILSSELFDADANNPADRFSNGPESDFVTRLRATPGVVDVRRSNLYSLQVNVLPEDNDYIVILVDMAHRYDNVDRFLRKHNMQLIELHGRPTTPEMTGVEVRQYSGLGDALQQVALIDSVSLRSYRAEEAQTKVEVKVVKNPPTRMLRGDGNGVFVHNNPPYSFRDYCEDRSWIDLQLAKHPGDIEIAEFADRALDTGESPLNAWIDYKARYDAGERA